MRILYKSKNGSGHMKKHHKIQRLPNTPRYDYTQAPYPRQRLINVASSRSQLERREMSTGATTRTTRKKKKSSVPGRIFFLILFIAGIIYLINIVVQTAQKPIISYQTVQRGILDNAEILTGIIVRNEEIIMSEDSGSIHLITNEGDKVKKSGDVYQLLDPKEVSVISQNIQEVESDIEKVQNKRQEVSYYQNEIQKVNNNISNSIQGFYMLNKDGQMSYTHALKKELEYEITKRKNIHMQDNSSTLNTLKTQRNDLTAQLNKNQKLYASPYSGIVSYYIDGYENKFTVETISDITEKDIEQNYTYQNTTLNETINSNEPVYKIIQDDQWYIVCFMPKDWAEKFQVGSKYAFTLIKENDIELILTVESNAEDGKKHKVVFSSREQLESFLDTRTISFKSLQYKYEGLKIPLSAIIERNLIKIPSKYIIEHDGMQGVLKRTGDSQEGTFFGVDIQFKDDDYTYIFQDFTKQPTVQLGDSIINPSKGGDIYVVSEVSAIEGVYAVNGRITKFKRISILTHNNEYAIVQSDLLGGLKQFDQIITNPKNVYGEQLLRNMDVINSKK